jgi:hypothetical protein
VSVMAQQVYWQLGGACAKRLRAQVTVETWVSSNRSVGFVCFTRVRS